MTYDEIVADIKSSSEKRVILDTDTCNEMDDQYAIAYAVGCSKIKLEAITAAPYTNDPADLFADGMENSYNEALRILNVIGKDGYCDVLRGSTERFKFGASDSPAAQRIIKESHNKTSPLYILAIGCLSNIASALKMDPSIKDNAILVWLGSNCLEHPKLNEYNACGDYEAAQYVIDSGIKIILLPACGAIGHGTQMLVADKEKLKGIKGDRPAAKFFREDFPRSYTNGAFDLPGWDRIIWDIAAPGLFSVPDAFEISEIPAPIFRDDFMMDFDDSREHILYMEKLNAKVIFDDLFEIISNL